MFAVAIVLGAVVGGASAVGLVIGLVASFVGIGAMVLENRGMPPLDRTDDRAVAAS